ncbi:MAG TPA: hypothetical protein VFB38_06750 [Chthonomonadaceae bacterium]|nr:hypothetical protein [Chthonomonadaceae bacterium]
MQTPVAQAKAVEESLSLMQIARLLNAPIPSEARDRAVRQLLPFLWSRKPWLRYRALCTLTTRIYLPYGLHPLEWRSFPNIFRRKLLALGYRQMPETPEQRRAAVNEALFALLERMVASLGVWVSVSLDVAVDTCEAVGRLGLYEGEAHLLSLLYYCDRGTYDLMGSLRMAIMLALAALPPERLERFWKQLSHGRRDQRELLAAAIHYMSNPEAVPFLMHALPYQTGEFQDQIARPILLKLGSLGDLRALPVLQGIARDEDHPLRPVARKAIQRLMKQAQGHEEVTLVRAAQASTPHADTLLRPARERPETVPEELLRPAESESQSGAHSRSMPEPQPGPFPVDGNNEAARTPGSRGLEVKD